MIYISQNEMFLICMVGWFVLTFVRFKLFNKDKIEEITFHNLMKILFCIYIIYLLSKIYFPISFSIGIPSSYLLPVFWLNPITSMVEIYKEGGMEEIIYNFGGNFIMLIPLSFFMCYFYEDWCFDLKVILKLMFLVSLLIECTQVFESLMIPMVSRYFETADIILNTLGGILGYYPYSWFKVFINKQEHRKYNSKGIFSIKGPQEDH